MELFFKSVQLSANIFLRNSQLFVRPVTLSVRCLSAVSSSPKVKDYARTPYILFFTDKYSEISQANPGVKPTARCRIIGQLWRLLPEEEKQPYRDRYVEEKAACDAQRQARLDAMTEAEKNEMQLIAGEKKRRRNALKRRRLEKKMEKPRPGDINPFLLFLKAKTVERGDAPLNQYVKGLSEHWKKMPVEDKEIYVKTARANSVRYRAKLAEWERRMIAQNHPELVRQSVLKKASARPKAPGKGKKKPSDAAAEKGEKTDEKEKTKSKAKTDVGTQTPDPHAKPKASKKKPAPHSEE